VFKKEKEKEKEKEKQIIETDKLDRTTEA